MNYYENHYRISNSTLNGVANIPQKAALFGRAFHELILESKTELLYHLTQFEVDQIYSMRKEVLKTAVGRVMFDENGTFTGQNIEHAYYFEIDGIPVKCKVDGTFMDSVIDPKTTMAKTYEECLKSMEDYNYYRQAWFYMKATGKKSMFFIFYGKSGGCWIIPVEWDQVANKSAQYIRAINQRWEILSAEHGMEGCSKEEWRNYVIENEI
jgi:hypothetical protein